MEGAVPDQESRSELMIRASSAVWKNRLKLPTFSWEGTVSDRDLSTPDWDSRLGIIIPHEATIGYPRSGVPIRTSKFFSRRDPDRCLVWTRSKLLSIFRNKFFRIADWMNQNAKTISHMSNRFEI